MCCGSTSRWTRCAAEHGPPPRPGLHIDRHVIAVSDIWTLLMALMVIIGPLWLAWALLVWGERRPPSRSAPAKRDPH